MFELAMKSKYLKADAKKSIGPNTKSLKEAYKILQKTYGNACTIWQRNKDVIEKAFSKYGAWGKTDTIERRNAISLLLEYLNEAERLTEDFTEMKAQIFSHDTVRFLYNLLPLGDIKRDAKK